MTELSIALGSQTVRIKCPDAIKATVEFLFPTAVPFERSFNHWVEISALQNGNYQLKTSSDPLSPELKECDLPEFLMEAVVRGLVIDMDDGVALHSGAISHDNIDVLIAGSTGAGKSTLTALLVDRGFDYLTDELVILSLDQPQQFESFPRPISLRADTFQLFEDNGSFKQDEKTIFHGDKAFVKVDHSTQSAQFNAGMILFPQFVSGSQLQIRSLTSPNALMKLLENNLNAQCLDDGGLHTLARLAQNAPAFAFTYGDAAQLDGVIETLINLVSETKIAPKVAAKLFGAFSAGLAPAAISQTTVQAPKPIAPLPTPPKGNFKLTIGMATYDDYDGVYFTIQSLRLHNQSLMKDVEFVVVDNNPLGPCAKALKELENENPNYRYIPFGGQSGTCMRNLVFDEASGDFVMCLDCHVLLAPGALQALFDYISENPSTNDLIQGPLAFDRLNSFATHFEQKWQGGMYGVWADAVESFDDDAQPFEIGMQGLGLFVCRKEAWPRFNAKFKGFGGEEGYIHQKFRNRGDRTLCIPQLQWMHRFQRPMGIPYKPSWLDRIRNYSIGHRELAWDEAEMHAHFKEVIGDEPASRLIDEVSNELANPFNRFDSLYCFSADEHTDRWDDAISMCASIGIEKLISRLAVPPNSIGALANRHREMLENEIRARAKTVFVFEDTAKLRKSFKANLDELLDQLEISQWDILIFWNSSEKTRNMHEDAIGIAYHEKAMRKVADHILGLMQSGDGLETKYQSFSSVLLAGEFNILHCNADGMLFDTELN